VSEYCNGCSIKSLAKKVNYSPYLLARLIVETVAGLKKKTLAKAMRDPQLHLGSIDAIADEFRATETSSPVLQGTGTTRLAMEVQESIDMDPIYGPLQDKERHLVGVEYEVVLEFDLTSLGLPFETEAQLRERGTSRTPDILLSSPLGIEVPKSNGETEWKVICWIDSKVSQSYRCSVCKR
jgi:hypothetical protein